MMNKNFLSPDVCEFWREFFVTSTLDAIEVCECMADSLRLPRATFIITSGYQVAGLPKRDDFVGIEVTALCGQLPLKFEIFDRRFMIKPGQAYIMIFDLCARFGAQVVTENPLSCGDPYSDVIFEEDLCKSVELKLLEEGEELCTFIENTGDTLFTRAELLKLLL